MQTIATPSSVFALVWHPDGASILGGQLDGVSQLWRIVDGVRLQTYLGHTRRILSAAISSNGQALITGSEDRTARSFFLGTGTPIDVLSGHAGDVSAVGISFAGNGFYITGSSDGTYRYWSQGSQTVFTIGSKVNAASFLGFATADLVIGSDRSVRQNRISGRISAQYGGEVADVDVAPNGRWIAVAASVANVFLEPLKEPFTRASLVGHTDNVTSVDFSPDGEELASAALDLRLNIWNVVTRTLRLSIPIPSTMRRMDWLPGNRA